MEKLVQNYLDSDALRRACAISSRTDDASATAIAPGARSVFNANALLLGVIMMNADQMTTEVMLAREGPSTGLVWACEWLGAMRVMRRHVGLQVVCPSESSRTVGALILATAVANSVLSGSVFAHVNRDSWNWESQTD